MADSPIQLTNFDLVKQKRRNQYFDEDLGNGISLRLMDIPAGTFQMGSPEDELERESDEGPQHEVSVPRFFLGKYPITQAQWRAVAAMDQVENKLNLNPSRFEGDDRPVEQVSWHDATEFCQRLSRYTGRTYLLPSEAEWEYACRASTTTPFHFGETITTDLANYRGTDAEDPEWLGSYGDGPKGQYRDETTPVGYFEVANEFGLSDMHGNVYEWCQDHYHSSYKRAPDNGAAWINENPEKELHILRGGSWLGAPKSCRAAQRSGLDPFDRFSYIGFRVVCATPRGPLIASPPVSPAIALTKADSQNLAEAAKEIQDLLLELAKDNPLATNDDRAEYVRQALPQNYLLRIIKLTQIVGESAFESFPGGKVITEILKKVWEQEAVQRKARDSEI